MNNRANAMAAMAFVILLAVLNLIVVIFGIEILFACLESIHWIPPIP